MRIAVEAMRQLVAVTVLLVCCVLTPTKAWGRDCKPDVVREDKITKQRIEIWTQVLSATSFAGSLWGSAEVTITATVGRYGPLNAINLEIQKKEAASDSLAFDDVYRAAAGKPIYFGVKDAEPIALTVTDVSNDARMAQGLFDKKGVTTVVLSATVPNAELARLRDSLTTKPVDALRVLLAGDQRIEKSVDEKSGKRLMEKFQCFYQALDDSGVNLSSGEGAVTQRVRPASPSDVSIPGKYVRKGKSSDYIELHPDGTFFLQQDGKGHNGSYNVQADALTVQVLNAPAYGLRINGNTIVEPDGTLWEKQAEPQKLAVQLTIDQVIQMVTAKLADDIIITTIQNSNSRFDLTPAALIKLKTAGVSDAVIRAMTR